MRNCSPLLALTLAVNKHPEVSRWITSEPIQKLANATLTVLEEKFLQRFAPKVRTQAEEALDALLTGRVKMDPKKQGCC